MKIHRALLNSPTSDFRPRLASALDSFCDILSEKGEFEKRLEFAQESVDILQNVLREIVEWETQVQSEPEPLQNSNQSENRETSTRDSFENATYLLPLNTSARHRCHCDYDASLVLEKDMAFAFRNLARGLDGVGRHSESYEMEKLALAIFRDLYSRHPGTFAPHVAESLRYLSRPLPDRPQSDRLLFAEEAVKIYCKLRSRYPTKFLKSLYEALWHQAFSLWDSGNLDKALKISSEAIEFSRQSHHDRLLLADSLHLSSYGLRDLKQDEDAVKLRQEAVDIYRDLIHDPPSTKLVLTIMPDRLLNLADGLQLIGRFDEAVIANREAVERYCSIALGDNTSTPDLAKALSSLLHALIGAAKYDEALDVGQEVLMLYRKLIRDNPNLIHPFLRALRRCAFASRHSDDPETIRRSAEIVQDYRTLMAHYSDTVGWGLVIALRDHGFVLRKHRRYSERLLNGEGLVGLFKSIPVESAETAAKFIDSFNEHAYMLTVAGHVKKATAVIKDAIAVAEPFIADSNDLVEALADSFSNISLYLHISGQYEDALANSERSVELSQAILLPTTLGSPAS
jgi:tetratricopeptide (TPR) repeat protein